ncbi:MAG: gliding motility protein GldM [Bacteroidales bacterium]|jgi:gliding motility-associated protein GldM|nr:gliding motility protein GldM [Bacteroidales bacterium]
MGATNCPETPRQRMISMMYLVYTAMLALNVSAEILQAFQTVGDSMEVTNKLLQSKADDSYIRFENAYKANPDKVADNWNKALEVKKATREMLSYIDSIKYELVAKVDGLKGGIQEAKAILDAENFAGVVHKDNYSIPTNYFFAGTEDNGGTAGKAIELRNRIEAYQSKMLSYIDEKNKARILKTQVATKDEYHNAAKQEVNWQMYNFYHTIVLADMVILNKIKSEIQNSELEIINSLYSAVSADDFKFDKVNATAIPKSTYVIQGNGFEADILVYAYDSKSKLRAEINGQNLYSDTSGMVKLKLGANVLGPQKYSGKVFVKKDFSEEEYPFNGEYFVAAPSATISLDKMNVFYIGVANPISISVPGANSEQIFPTITGAGNTITKVAPGKYEVNVKAQGKVSIAVSANINGKTMQMATYEYRVKPIPRPVAAIGNLSGGSITKEELAAQGNISIKVDGFDFPVRFVTTSFKMQVAAGGDSEAPMISNGPNFTTEMLNRINKLRRGNKVFFEEIRAKGPAGEMRPSNESIVLTIK